MTDTTADFITDTTADFITDTTVDCMTDTTADCITDNVIDTTTHTTADCMTDTTADFMTDTTVDCITDNIIDTTTDTTTEQGIHILTGDTVDSQSTPQDNTSIDTGLTSPSSSPPPTHHLDSHASQRKLEGGEGELLEQMVDVIAGEDCTYMFPEEDDLASSKDQAHHPSRDQLVAPASSEQDTGTSILTQHLASDTNTTDEPATSGCRDNNNSRRVGVVEALMLREMNEAGSTSRDHMNTTMLHGMKESASVNVSQKAEKLMLYDTKETGSASKEDVEALMLQKMNVAGSASKDGIQSLVQHGMLGLNYNNTNIQPLVQQGFVESSFNNSIVQPLQQQATQDISSTSNTSTNQCSNVPQSFSTLQPHPVEISLDHPSLLASDPSSSLCTSITTSSSKFNSSSMSTCPSYTTSSSSANPISSTSTSVSSPTPTTPTATSAIHTPNPGIDPSASDQPPATTTLLLTIHTSTDTHVVYHSQITTPSSPSLSATATPPTVYPPQSSTTANSKPFSTSRLTTLPPFRPIVAHINPPTLHCPPSKSSIGISPVGPSLARVSMMGMNGQRILVSPANGLKTTSCQPLPLQRTLTNTSSKKQGLCVNH